DNYASISLDKTAKHFGFNPKYFSSLVKQKTGKSFVEHVDERRMEEARNLLARPDISVKEIIRRVGYSGKSFFYKKFNEYYHETPVQMRAELFRQANINLK
ncbi:AraC family transcriptional regulator, partial [Lactobacillus sp. XV13L]|nr:AraC family transcriptional regulator [Lactobacillus sp. XV13L]